MTDETITLARRIAERLASWLRVGLDPIYVARAVIDVLPELQERDALLARVLTEENRANSALTRLAAVERQLREADAVISNGPAGIVSRAT